MIDFKKKERKKTKTKTKIKKPLSLLEGLDVSYPSSFLAFSGRGVRKAMEDSGSSSESLKLG